MNNVNCTFSFVINSLHKIHVVNGAMRCAYCTLRLFVNPLEWFG